MPDGTNTDVQYSKEFGKRVMDAAVEQMTKDQAAALPLPGEVATKIASLADPEPVCISAAAALGLADAALEKWKKDVHDVEKQAKLREVSQAVIEASGEGLRICRVDLDQGMSQHTEFNQDATRKSLLAALEELGYKVMAKPRASGHGRHVFSDYELSWRHARK